MSKETHNLLKIYDQEAPEVINLLEDVLFEIRDSLIDGDVEGLKKLLHSKKTQIISWMHL